ncbi:MAG TPA: 3-deoxy-manno-octulosonate cytidylyltransferase [Candidatus Kapabacteria bacterium]|jgi:3-deoxy-manno-octulosonate cytidylyltransferase (CMP-KDO synthetase)
MQSIIIIPSRYASQRLPAKPLAMIAGMTMIERVYRQCKKADGVDGVFIATDHPAIADEANRFRAGVIMTSSDCPSGTDRVAAAAAQLPLDRDSIVINVQGDEPLIDPAVITALVNEMKFHKEVRVATPITPLKHVEELTNPNVVFAVTNKNNDALYFSRHPIPYHRELGQEQVHLWPERHPYLKHIGVYAYRAEALEQFTALGESPLERAERLEQLRLLEAGIPIRCVEVNYESVAVDTAEDIQKVEHILKTS